jgi:hypothetical protein
LKALASDLEHQGGSALIDYDRTKARHRVSIGLLLLGLVSLLVLGVWMASR